ncbi:unnamed protein product [Moneuplotes crassus]|uniref:Uncharacterized protein n=1 Tax=Euplotes crassus TaxID=5936 RepID=A0AAD1XP28_EUPCR|nr:unnamed protein product [Moneuplotes crassus]
MVWKISISIPYKWKSSILCRYLAADKTKLSTVCMLGNSLCQSFCFCFIHFSILIDLNQVFFELKSLRSLHRMKHCLKFTRDAFEIIIIFCKVFPSIRKRERSTYCWHFETEQNKNLKSCVYMLLISSTEGRKAVESYLNPSNLKIPILVIQPFLKIDFLRNFITFLFFLIILNLSTCVRTGTYFTSKSPNSCSTISSSYSSRPSTTHLKSWPSLFLLLTLSPCSSLTSSSFTSLSSFSLPNISLYLHYP